MNKEEMEEGFQDGLKMISEILTTIPTNEDEFNKLKYEYMQSTHAFIPQETDCRICDTHTVCVNAIEAPICFACANERADRMKEFIAEQTYKKYEEPAEQTESEPSETEV